MKNEHLFICACVAILLCGCQSIKPLETSTTDEAGVKLQETQAQISAQSHDLGGTIDAIAAAAKESPTKEQAAEIVRLAPIAVNQKNALLKSVDSMTSQLAKFQLSRIQDAKAAAIALAAKDAEIEKYKPWQGRFLVAAMAYALLLAGAAGYVVLRLKAIVK